MNVRVQDEHADLADDRATVACIPSTPVALTSPDTAR